ncbi:hypothetical protein HU200_008434 [Digitaria exilis]|uniref:Uncharacterized protein n=1 Tax=Digitaria exilis TaxID=1010633 RepID=A0A835FL64_9POAL|nr:hypothetical protein HU200_008434 [Digitaria exilis]
METSPPTSPPGPPPYPTEKKKAPPASAPCKAGTPWRFPPRSRARAPAGVLFAPAATRQAPRAPAPPCPRFLLRREVTWVVNLRGRVMKGGRWHVKAGLLGSPPPLL